MYSITCSVDRAVTDCSKEQCTEHNNRNNPIRKYLNYKRCMAKNTKKNNRWKIGKTELEISMPTIGLKRQPQNCEHI